MCIFGRTQSPAPPAPLPPPPAAPTPPPQPDIIPEAEVRPVNPNVREAQSKLGTKKGVKGGTSDLRIKKNPASSGAAGSINTGNTGTSTGGLQ
tara:strand:- start:2519 stop:2797 length:279 start_codon:yes stop_codon:yes gene_type:complete